MGSLAAGVLRRLGVLVLLYGLGLSAHAATITLSSFPPDPGVLPGGGWKYTTGTTFATPTPPRAWVNGVYGSVPKIVATDTMALAGRAGTLTVAAAQRVALADAAGAVARCVMGSIPICAAGTVAAAAYAAYRIRGADDYPGTQAAAGELAFDPGTNTTTTVASLYCGQYASGFPNRCAASKLASVTAQGEDYKATLGNCGAGPAYGTPGTRTLVGADPTWYIRTDCGTGSYGYSNAMGATLQTVTSTECPASIDASNPAYNVPAGSPVGLDGKCPTARYNHVPYTEAQAKAKVAAYPPDLSVTSSPSPAADWRNALKDSVDTGGQQVPAEIDATGPSSQTGSPVSTTTTSPGGTTTTTTVPTYNYTYAGDTITYNTTNTTYTCAGAGACSSSNATTTTTTTTGTPVPDAQKPDDPCTANPERVGCKSLGSAPTDVVPKTTRDVGTFTPESLGSSGSCPSPIAMGSSGHSISFTVLCDGLTTARPLVIAIGFFMAAAIVVAALKT